MWLALHQVRPDEGHGGAGRGGQQNEARHVALDLAGRQERPEQMADEKPAEQGHGEGFYQPVDADRGGDAAPVAADLAERGEVDLQQHRNDHQPDQCGDRQIDMGDRCRADCLEQTRHELAEEDAGDDAQSDPQCEVALENPQGRRVGRADGRGGDGFTHWFASLV
jgi:hypothetical protein